MEQIALDWQPLRRTFTVGELSAEMRAVLAEHFTDIWVSGEISGTKVPASGHYYFTLKDESAQLRAVCYKMTARYLKFKPQDGVEAVARGRIDVYDARGEVQLVVDALEPLGHGALQLAFEQLKKRLEAEGLFSPERKKPLPMLPSRIGLITSPSGAAVRDVIRILRRRFPNVCLTLYPVRVQGDGSATEIVKALKFFNQKKFVDVLILARGGGSLEDLWAFNEEILARAIADSEIPVISGVGHETDFTIADFVADVRASTPSAAAELVVQTRREFDKHIADLRETIASLIRHRLLSSSRRVHELSGRRGFRRPLDLLRQQRQRADEMTSRLAQGLRARLEQSRKRFTTAHVRIVSFDFRTKINAMCRRVDAHAARMEAALRAKIEHSHKKFNVWQLRILSFDFRAKISALQLRLEKRDTELAIRIDRQLRIKSDGLTRLIVQLNERNPKNLLARGYAIATDAVGNILKSVEGVNLGDAVTVQLRHGQLTTEVKRKSDA
jgi:exodeoxyribonuclease VII large subunit